MRVYVTDDFFNSFVIVHGFMLLQEPFCGHPILAAELTILKDSSWISGV